MADPSNESGLPGTSHWRVTNNPYGTAATARRLQVPVVPFATRGGPSNTSDGVTTLTNTSAEAESPNADSTFSCSSLSPRNDVLNESLSPRSRHGPHGTPRQRPRTRQW